MYLIQLDLNYSLLLFQLFDFSNTGKLWKKKYTGTTFLIPGLRQTCTHKHMCTHIQTKQAILFIIHQDIAQKCKRQTSDASRTTRNFHYYNPSEFPFPKGRGQESTNIRHSL